MRTVRLILDYRHVTIQRVTPKTIAALEKVTSYLVAGYFFAPAYKARRWDGREHLLVLRKGRYQAPIGLLGVIKQTLRARGVQFEVKRRRQEIPKRHFIWNDEIVLRDYQNAAVDAFCSKPERGRGIISMPIRSGKTKVAAAITERLCTRTIFIVPSAMLLHQAAASLRESLVGTEIGMIGDSRWSEGDVTVATVQTLTRLRGGTLHQCSGNRTRDESGNWIKTKHPKTGKIRGTYDKALARCGRKRCDGAHGFRSKRDPRYEDLINSYGFAIFDECHHLKAEAWRKVMLDFQVLYRLGLSATAFLESKKEQERGVIWLRGCCGPERFKVETSDLIERGFLMRQHVEMYRVAKPKAYGEPWSGDLRNRCILENVHRNRGIAKITKRKLREGLNVMIVTGRLNQIRAVSDQLEARGIDHVAVTGRDSARQRADKVEAFKLGGVSVIIGTVFGEGVDIPEVECVIVGEGGTDAKATIQRMRNMTPSKGKTRCVLVDFWDDTNKYFRKHSRSRLKTYQSESAFVVRKMWEKHR